MADSKTTLRLLTLHRAAEFSGMSEQEILDCAAIGEITAGVIVPHWGGYATPRKGGNLDIGVSDGKYSLTGEWTATHYHVTSSNQPPHTVPVFSVCNFWKLGGEVAYLAREDKPKEVNFLYPHDDVCRKLGETLMPWGDGMVQLTHGQTITRQDLRFLHAEIEALAGQNSEAQQTPQPTAVQDAAPEKTSKVFTAPDGTKGKKQEAAVLFWIAQKKWNTQAVPDSEKGTIAKLCKESEETRRLFTADYAFDETWRRLRKNGLVRTENHDSYTRRGN